MISRQLNYVCKKDDIWSIHIVVVHHILNIDFFNLLWCARPFDRKKLSFLQGYRFLYLWIALFYVKCFMFTHQFNIIKWSEIKKKTIFKFQIKSSQYLYLSLISRTEQIKLSFASNWLWFTDPNLHLLL